jgi:hypothetical protein
MLLVASTLAIMNNACKSAQYNHPYAGPTDRACRVRLFLSSGRTHQFRGLREGQTYYRWCFSDLAMAHAFIEQFGGSLYEPERRVATRRKRLR